MFYCLVIRGLVTAQEEKRKFGCTRAQAAQETACFRKVAANSFRTKFVRRLCLALTKCSKLLVAMRLWETPVPIPNTMVKPQAADGTALETVWESRWLPDFKRKYVYSFIEVKASWGCSSVGRAPALQAGGQGFESLHLQLIRSQRSWGLGHTAGCVELAREQPDGWHRRRICGAYP